MIPRTRALTGRAVALLHHGPHNRPIMVSTWCLLSAWRRASAGILSISYTVTATSMRSYATVPSSTSGNSSPADGAAGATTAYTGETKGSGGPHGGASASSAGTGAGSAHAQSSHAGGNASRQAKIVQPKKKLIMKRKNAKTGRRLKPHATGATAGSPSRRRQEKGARAKSSSTSTHAGHQHHASTASGGGTAASASSSAINTRAKVKRAQSRTKNVGSASLSGSKSSTSLRATNGNTTPADSTHQKNHRADASTGGRTTKSTGNRSRRRRKKVRVCVLSSSYEGADSATASVDNYWCTPQHYIKKDMYRYTFDDVAMKKNDSYKTVRELVTSNKFDVFFNLCDGGRDEKRAGVDVVEALEEHNAAFTGTDSRSFEPSKIDMKLMVGSSGVTVPNFVLLNNGEALAKKCRHLKFPVIVKHLSGYASVGIHKDNKCNSLEQLKVKVPSFIKEYNHALVEEFICGREGTVLACADAGSPFGIKVFKPLMFNFLQNSEDFAYFDKKWTMECNDSAYGFLPVSDPAMGAIVEMARNAFKYIMNGVGYGRVDFRIDERTGVPHFLEINPNCGMWYAPKDGGDFADVMVEGDAHWNHERFVANAITRALREQAARRPWYFISHDRNGHFSTRASKTVTEGKCLFGDAVHPIPVVSKALYKLGEEEPTVGCVICRGDGVHQAVALRHSCEPNMQFVHGRTLLFAAKRQINVGEELTVDYATLRDESMPHFVCSCGTEKCRSIIFPMPATARTVEAKMMRRLLREKRQVWLKEKADREAERILKKRSSATELVAESANKSGPALDEKKSDSER